MSSHLNALVPRESRSRWTFTVQQLNSAMIGGHCAPTLLQLTTSPGPGHYCKRVPFNPNSQPPPSQSPPNRWEARSQYHRGICSSRGTFISSAGSALSFPAAEQAPPP